MFSLLYNNYLHHILKKLRLEFKNFINNFLHIGFCIFNLVYICSALGRNIAYYRSIQDDRLKDIGFDIIPELSSNWKIVSEIIIILNQLELQHQPT